MTAPATMHLFPSKWCFQRFKNKMKMCVYLSHLSRMIHLKPMDKKREDDFQGISKMIFKIWRCSSSNLIFERRGRTPTALHGSLNFCSLTYTLEWANEKNMILYVLNGCPNFQMTWSAIWHFSNMWFAKHVMSNKFFLS